jgi:drug/metabolite transporter (DMT)-like permease
LLTLMVLFWAFNFVIARIALREFPSLLAAGIRALLAGSILLPLYLWRGKQLDKEPWSWKDVPTLLILGVSGVSFNQTLFLTGLERTSTSHAAILTGIMPLQVMVISALFGVEFLSSKKIVGMLIALGGVAVLQFARQTGGTPPTFLGDLLVFGSGTAFAVFAVMGKKLTLKHGGLTVTTFAFLGGGVALLPVIFWTGHGFQYGNVSMTGWLSLLYMALFPSAIAYLIFYYALTHIPASRVSTFSYLQPLMAMMLGVWLLDDRITTTLVAGGSLVLTGVFVTERS